MEVELISECAEVEVFENRRGADGHWGLVRYITSDIAKFCDTLAAL